MKKVATSLTLFLSMSICHALTSHEQHGETKYKMKDFTVYTNIKTTLNRMENEIKPLKKELNDIKDKYRYLKIPKNDEEEQLAIEVRKMFKPKALKVIDLENEIADYKFLAKEIEALQEDIAFKENYCREKVYEALKKELPNDFYKKTECYKNLQDRTFRLAPRIEPTLVELQECISRYEKKMGKFCREGYDKVHEKYPIFIKMREDRDLEGVNATKRLNYLKKNVEEVKKHQDEHDRLIQKVKDKNYSAEELKLYNIKQLDEKYSQQAKSELIWAQIEAKKLDKEYAQYLLNWEDKSTAMTKALKEKWIVVDKESAEKYLFFLMKKVSKEAQIELKKIGLRSLREKHKLTKVRNVRVN
jgi:hypothetical protein